MASEIEWRRTSGGCVGVCVRWSTKWMSKWMRLISEKEPVSYKSLVCSIGISRCVCGLAETVTCMPPWRVQSKCWIKCNICYATNLNIHIRIYNLNTFIYTLMYLLKVLPFDSWFFSHTDTHTNSYSPQQTIGFCHLNKCVCGQRAIN